MGSLTRSDRQTLTDLLLRLPNINNMAARNLLLADLPPDLQQAIAAEPAPAVHIANIIEKVSAWQERAGEESPIAIVIENAIYTVRGSRLADELRTLLNKVQGQGGGTSAAPVVASGTSGAATNSGAGTQWNTGGQSAARDINQGNTYGGPVAGNDVIITNHYYGSLLPTTGTDPVAPSSPRPAVAGQTLQLSTAQQQTLRDALLSAFPTRDSLAQMMQFYVGQNLEIIAGGGNLSSVVRDIMQWAEAGGQTAALIRGAITANPGNPTLRAFAAQVGITPSA